MGDVIVLIMTVTVLEEDAGVMTESVMMGLRHEMMIGDTTHVGRTTIDLAALAMIIFGGRHGKEMMMVVESVLAYS